MVGTYSMMALTNSFTILEKYGKHGNSATFLFLAHQGNPERILFFRGPTRGPRLAEEKKFYSDTLDELKNKTWCSLVHSGSAIAIVAVACSIKAPYFCVLVQ